MGGEAFYNRLAFPLFGETENECWHSSDLEVTLSGGKNRYFFLPSCPEAETSNQFPMNSTFMVLCWPIASGNCYSYFVSSVGDP